MLHLFSPQVVQLFLQGIFLHLHHILCPCSKDLLAWIASSQTTYGFGLLYEGHDTTIHI